MNRLVQALGQTEDRQRCLVNLRVTPAKQGAQAPWPDWLGDEVTQAYQARGLDQPWRHQVEAMELIHAGRHTVIATGTGSGKSLAFWAPLLDACLPTDPLGDIGAVAKQPTVLYLAPTKALAADQLAALGATLRAGDLQTAVTTCDGDSGRELRQWAQAKASIVLSNPDYLHFSMLPRHHQWARFLRSLRFVVVDEAHAYRGVSGGHVSMVLRRLRRLAANLGTEPQFLFASASLAEPAAGAARLAGLDEATVAVVSDDTADAGERTEVMWKPLAKDQQGKVLRQPAGAAAAELAAGLTDLGARSVVFVRSRFAAESVAQSIRQLLPKAKAARVATYRGGYLAEDRRALEQGLRQGSLLTVVATSALELGIDIAGLDAVITAGWPGTRVALAQQLGRTGRAGANGLAVWVAGTDPFDSYLVDHPEALYDAPLEASVFDPANPYLLAPHLSAAAGELPLTKADGRFFGPAMAGVVDQLVTLGVLRHRPTGWHWLPPDSPTLLTDLRGAGGHSVDLVEDQTGRVLGSVDRGRAPATVHPGAVYLHQGASFLVETLDLEALVAVLKPARPPYRTMPISQSTLRVADDVRCVEEAGASWHFGRVEVVDQVVGYQRLSNDGLGRSATIPLELPADSLNTTAVWCLPTAEAISQLGPELLPAALHGAEHAAIGLMPLLAACDRWDLGGLSIPAHPQTGGATIFIYDGVPGGAGLAERAFSRRRELLQATEARLAQCDCDEGCPSCVQSPKCGNANQILSKPGALALVRAMLQGVGE
ncbi:MAG: DEAD/DEAH box helicase [Micrococcales bacterium]|nr:DEAD/DEAH box helicase [Micrococcales bacterium]